MSTVIVHKFETKPGILFERKRIHFNLTFTGRFLPRPQPFNETASTCSEHGARPAEFQEEADRAVFKEIFREFPQSRVHAFLVS